MEKNFFAFKESLEAHKANSNVGASITSWLEQNSCGGQRAQFEYGVRTRWY